MKSLHPPVVMREIVHILYKLRINISKIKITTLVHAPGNFNGFLWLESGET